MGCSRDSVYHKPGNVKRRPEEKKKKYGKLEETLALTHIKSV
jgi:hypothetical protein